jgi:hypothetical protein
MTSVRSNHGIHIIRLGLVLVASCGSTLLAPYESGGLNPSIIAYHSQGPVLDVPDSVAVGLPFRATFATYSGNCATPGPTAQHWSGDRVEISPRTVLPPSGRCVEQVLVVATVYVDVVPKQRGTLTVTLRGTRVSSVNGERLREWFMTSRTVRVH